MGRTAEENREAKGREFFYLAILSIFVLVLIFNSDGKKGIKGMENSRESSNTIKTQNISREPIIKFELLKERKVEKKEGRNIFQPLKPKFEPPPKINETKEEVEEEFEVPFKLVCIIENSNSENTRYAVLSRDEDMIFAKKGDILSGEIEILDVEKEGVIFKSLKNGKTKRLEFEEK